MNRSQLITEIKALDSRYPDEQALQIPFADLLQHPRAYHRDHLPGHITGSGWIVNENFSSVLLVLHAKLSRWLQPGGHADGDENVLAVALREAGEETGIKKFKILRPSVFDIDIHPIPTRKDFSEHLHYDVRFLLQASEQDPLIISDESNDLKWFPLDEIESLTGNAGSIMRMVSKTRNL